ncbi:hypothetical protein MSG28_006303 [Choristoneura fumiferana]|uniref:Uncharacterized protein n=1 Tax=Choristoneura fumiferana TaxID=7141 RepID=A0ACC0JEH4_CHOFU|nr:hypothetical protein MSG28_006303 [Choristoneura fumiferana]
MYDAAAGDSLGDRCSLCLRNVHVLVPEAAERGSKVRMQCVYDLEQEVLYSVKWYEETESFVGTSREMRRRSKSSGYQGSKLW